MDGGKQSRQVEKRALAAMGKLKGHLRRIEGLFGGFQSNLQSAFDLHQTSQVVNNARGYAKMLEQDMAAVRKMMDFFDQGEKMLAEETPFDKD